MIIVGYQGIGKTSTCKHDIINGKVCIDLESSFSWVDVDGKYIRPEHWEKMYVNMAANLSRQGFIVFMSSHKIVRDALCSDEYIDIEKYIICPSLDIKNEWIERLMNRYHNTHTMKDYRAYINAVDDYDNNISDLISESSRGFIVKQINTIDYKLGSMIRSMVVSSELNISE